MHDYKGVTLACNRDKQIQRTLEQMTWGDGVHGCEGATLASDDNKQIQPELVR